MRLRFILIFGNKLIHSYNHDFNYHPNLQHRTIHSTIYSDDWLVNTVIMLLIIIGGIGFLVWDDLSVKKFQWKKYHLHTKIVLSTTGFLIIGGAVLFLILEKNNVLAGMPVKDTVKIVDDNNIVSQTPERKYVWIVQTPQVFDTELIKRAYRLLEKEGESAVTDDAMVVETMLGESVKLYEGSYENIKITTPEDLKVAEAFVGK